MTGLRKLTIAALAMAMVGLMSAGPLVAQTPTRIGGAAVPASLPAAVEIQLNQAKTVELPAVVTNVVVGNEGIADIHLDSSSPGKAFIIARRVGTTNVFFMGASGGMVHQLEINVTFDHHGVEAALRKLLPDRSIKVSVYRDSIFLTGSVRTAADSAMALSIARRFVPDNSNVVNMLSVKGSQQVILQVRVSEMARTIRKQLSVNQTGSQLLTDDKSISFTTASPAAASGLTAFATGTLITQLPGLGPTSFQVLERQGLVKTLAEPTLTAISGETATFLSGGEIPVPTGTDQAGNLSVTYRDFGVRLEFTPVVIDKGRINIRIATEISAIDNSTTVNLGTNVSIPALTQKRTETTVDLPSGGSLMISGLLEDNVTDTVNGIPGLKDIPILGALFRSTEFQRDETELVVTVTAFLVKPTGNDKALTVPSDGFEPASDIDLYLLGRLHREYTKKDRPIWASPLKGPFGYIME